MDELGAKENSSLTGNNEQGIVDSLIAKGIAFR
jgi:hypothetical protein